MRTTPIVVKDPLGHDLPQMPLIERNEMVETFPPRRADQSLAKRIRLRDAGGRFQDARTHRPQRIVYRSREHGIAIVLHEPVRVVAGQDAFGTAASSTRPSDAR